MNNTAMPAAALNLYRTGRLRARHEQFLDTAVHHDPFFPRLPANENFYRPRICNSLSILDDVDKFYYTMRL
jgi:hypothetical protein